MVFCTYCGQSFTRDEHLERHILTRKSFFVLHHHSRIVAGGNPTRLSLTTLFLDEQTPM